MPESKRVLGSDLARLDATSDDDIAAAREFADIAATRRRAGRPIGEADGRIAAIARSRGAILATRNVSDFAGIRAQMGPIF
jgi:predicted nucleic acid-binding protein